jgi:hypothetical protein
MISHTRIILTISFLFALLVLVLPSELSAQSTSARTPSVDTVVETDGFVPPLFGGKIDPRYQNAVKVIAIPHLFTAAGAEIETKNVYFLWRKNGLVLQSDSGYGKQALVVAGDIIPRAYSITVEVRTRDNSSSAKGIATIDLTPPSITFYIDDPQYGPLYQKAISETIRIGSEREIAVKAVPFGFSPKRIGTADLSKEWLINGTLHPELSTNETVILRSPDEVGGSATVQLSVRNLNEILQGANAGFTTIFSATTPTVNTSSF